MYSGSNACLAIFSRSTTPRILETAESIDGMDLPGLNLHNSKGKRRNTLAVNVSGNWRVPFKLQDGDVLEVNYEDYH